MQYVIRTMTNWSAKMNWVIAKTYLPNSLLTLRNYNASQCSYFQYDSTHEGSQRNVFLVLLYLLRDNNRCQPILGVKM